MSGGRDPRTRWLRGNQAYLLAELRRVARRVGADGAAEPAAELQQLLAEMPAPPALQSLSQGLALTPFERDVLLLCAGCELDASIAESCRQAAGAPLTFGSALALLEEPHWSALSPQAPLRRAHLIEVGSGQSLTTSPLRIDEWVLHFLTGVPGLDERLQAVMRPVIPLRLELLPASHAEVARQLIRLIEEERGRADDGLPALLWLCGPDGQDRGAVAAAATEELGLELYALRASELPASAGERELLRRLWAREVALTGAALLLRCDDAQPPELLRSAQAWAEQLPGVVLGSCREPVQGDGSDRRQLRLDIARPSTEERMSLWRDALAGIAEGPPLADAVEQVSVHFRLGAGGIAAASIQARAQLTDDGPAPTAALWDACRRQARPRLDELARRIEPRATWDSLVLPEPQRQLLHQLVAHQRHQATVYHRWGMGGGLGARGLGVTALFVGQSGTGKTLATEVLARELRLDLYHIDLSQVVSKYIGETEKNLRRVFDAAEEGGAVLLFDEADALFGKRSEVKDSHDRYANMEVSYLLQRMEAYQGISVLTSNLKSALDSAFLRRIRFIIQFPFPDPQQRGELWRRAFPKDVPTAGLIYERLARLSVTGGQIRNIALGAAFLAADEGQPVGMRHLLQSARNEFAKSERPLTESEIGGWV